MDLSFDLDAMSLLEQSFQLTNDFYTEEDKP